MPLTRPPPRGVPGAKRARSIGAPLPSINYRHYRDGLRKWPQAISANELIQLDLHVHARRKLELHEGVHRLVGGVHDVHEALVCAQLELIARVLVGVRGDEHREALHLGRQRYRSLDGGPGALGRLDDLAGRAVDQAMVERLQADTDVLIGHMSYFRIFVTTPAPTVLPPSRIAKRSPSSMAIGLISSIVILMLSPGMTISTPAGSSIVPVTSVVRK